ncbi:LapA family protein [Planococcus alpniumensis]|uniref:LapA family protein n=1 Tax=Planococcus alpniumensis TaxID=2708345 RepID=UPI001B8B0467|nr:lipopolysaccharide assembly protein LapA domain-containing protein [Planococcus sp. MSAK28401]
MKLQWLVLLAFLFAVLITIFAVVNVDTVPVNFVFGTADWPLILVILASALMGFLLSGSVALAKIYSLQKDKKAAQKGKPVKPKKNVSAS